VVEVHPELSFMALAGRASRDPLPSKRTPIGATLRERAIAPGSPTRGRPGDPDATTTSTRSPPRGRRPAGPTARPEGVGGEPDEHGIPMRIAV
jgi:hypothetical protein